MAQKYIRKATVSSRFTSHRLPLRNSNCFFGTDTNNNEQAQRKVGYLKKEINRKIGKAIHRFGLIERGDSIMVAVSGGADSLTMLYFLHQWKKKAPIDFEIMPVFMEMGYNGKRISRVLQGYFQSLELPFYMEETDYALYAHGSANRGKSPCFLCSWKRRKRLFQLTQILGCNKIAFGHNLDDVIETFFLNMFYSGEMSTMLPRQEMFNGLLTIVRPIVLVEKDKIKRLANKLGLPICENLCPSASKSKRNKVRQILSNIYRQDKKIKGNVARALFNPRPEYLPEKLPPP